MEKLGNQLAKAKQDAARAVANLAKAKGELTNPGSASPSLMLSALDWLQAKWNNLLACADIA
jgi:hypothetical protein